MHDPVHRRLLRRWLEWLDTLLGFNLLYDILYLRAWPEFRGLLDGRHFIVDGPVLNFLQDETTPEKSLKDIGPVLGLFRYDPEKTAKGGHRFESPLDPEHQSYNAQDTHNALLAITEFARKILDAFPGSAKLSPFCLEYFSGLLWSTVRLSEAGLPMHRASVAKVHSDCAKVVARTTAACAKLGLKLQGKGSPASKTACITAAMDWIDTNVDVGEILDVPSVYSHDLLEFTNKKREVSTTGVNRTLARLLLPEDHPLREMLDLWDKRTEANDMISRYTAPLLFRKRAEKSKSPFAACMLPAPSGEARSLGIQIAYPQWFLTPSTFKDDRGGSGGQKQARSGCKDPAAQQFPPDIKACVRSRRRGGVIVAPDLSQIELRTPALLSGEPSMVSAYLEGRDLHRERAIFTHGPEIVDDPNFGCGDVRTDPRQWNKKFNFEDLYWAGAGKMQSMMLKESGVLFPIGFFKKVVADRPILRPVLVEWQYSLLAEANANGYLILPVTGHSRYFETGTDGNKPNEMVNFPVQAVAALTMAAVQRRLHTKLPSINTRNGPCDLFMNWFDANYFDCDGSFVEDLRGLFAEAVDYVENREYWSWLQDHYGRKVPLKYEFKIMEQAE